LFRGERTPGRRVAGERLDDFKHNLQHFIDTAAATLNRCKGRAIVDGIMYQRLGSEQYHAQELLDQDIVGHLHRMITDTEHRSPLGTYNPDWAVPIEEEGRDRVYLVVETKGSLVPEALREAERGKIACGHAHFRALRVMEQPAECTVATTLSDVLNYAGSVS
jgi:type III restriction enzyme